MMLDFDLYFQRAEFVLHAKAQWQSGVIGLCGASGAGKSTLLALLTGLIPPQRGHLIHDGRLLIDTQAKIFIPTWRRHFGLVAQQGWLFPHLTVRENLLYGYQQLQPAQRHFELDTVARWLELMPLLTRRPAQLSGGERQRVALGRAVLYSPRLLLLDEPLSALDERLKQQILPFLQRIKQESQLPILYVSHHLAELEFLADSVFRLVAGRIVAGSQ